MKLGKDTGSLTNYMMSGTKGQPDPFVGMGVTLLHWSDRDPATIKRVDVPNSKLYLWEIEIWSDEVTVVSGSTHDGSAEYEYTQRDGWESGKGALWRLETRTGKWVSGKMDGKRFKKVDNGGLRIGHRESYYNPHF